MLGSLIGGCADGRAAGSDRTGVAVVSRVVDGRGSDRFQSSGEPASALLAVIARRCPEFHQASFRSLVAHLVAAYLRGGSLGKDGGIRQDGESPRTGTPQIQEILSGVDVTYVPRADQLRASGRLSRTRVGVGMGDDSSNAVACGRFESFCAEPGLRIGFSPVEQYEPVELKGLGISAGALEDVKHSSVHRDTERQDSKEPSARGFSGPRLLVEPLQTVREPDGRPYLHLSSRSAGQRRIRSLRHVRNIVLIPDLVAGRA